MKTITAPTTPIAVSQSGVTALGIRMHSQSRRWRSGAAVTLVWMRFEDRAETLFGMQTGDRALTKDLVPSLRKMNSDTTYPQLTICRCLVTHYAKLAAISSPSLSGKSVSPHMIRHTTAVHLLRAGVDINTIRAWLGHVSLDTTNIYAEVDMEMKAKALASVDISDEFSSLGRRIQLPSLMAFLKGL